MNILLKPEDLVPLINATTAKLNLASPAIVEKDYYVTQAIHIMHSMQSDYFSLVFQGGTALAKAHRIVERMSEDCDFRIHLTETGKQLALNQRRNKLRQFRQNIIEALQTNGFTVLVDKTKVRDAGNFFQLALSYESSYDKNEVLRPHVQLEFMVNNSRLPTVDLPITTLIKQTLGDLVEHPEKNMQCVSVNETAAEKWVALTRRVANATRNPHVFLDPTLVRHIYDLYSIENKIGTDETIFSLISSIIADDIDQYSNQNNEYTKNPMQEIKFALSTLNTHVQWKNNWNIFIDAMVYGDEKPSYENAITMLNNLSGKIFETI